MQNILEEIKAERTRQTALFGEQNHTPCKWMPILMEEVGEVAKEVCEYQFNSDYFKAKAHLKKYRAELVQVAAVAVQMIECLDRNS